MAEKKQRVFEQYRQGDVFIQRIAEAVPANAREVKREGSLLVLAAGTATGHHHAIADRRAKLFESDGARVLEIADSVDDLKADLSHEEHATVSFAPGRYSVEIQNEWSDEDEPRQVVD